LAFIFLKNKIKTWGELIDFPIKDSFLHNLQLPHIQTAGDEEALGLSSIDVAVNDIERNDKIIFPSKDIGPDLLIPSILNGETLFVRVQCKFWHTQLTPSNFCEAVESINFGSAFNRTTDNKQAYLTRMGHYLNQSKKFSKTIRVVFSMAGFNDKVNSSVADHNRKNENHPVILIDHNFVNANLTNNSLKNKLQTLVSKGKRSNNSKTNLTPVLVGVLDIKSSYKQQTLDNFVQKKPKQDFMSNFTITAVPQNMDEVKNKGEINEEEMDDENMEVEEDIN